MVSPATFQVAGKRDDHACRKGSNFLQAHKDTGAAVMEHQCSTDSTISKQTCTVYIFSSEQAQVYDN